MTKPITEYCFKERPFDHNWYAIWTAALAITVATKDSSDQKFYLEIDIESLQRFFFYYVK